MEQIGVGLSPLSFPFGCTFGIPMANDIKLVTILSVSVQNQIITGRQVFFVRYGLATTSNIKCRSTEQSHAHAHNSAAQ